MDEESVHKESLRGRILNIQLGTPIQIQAGGSGSPFKITGTMVGMQPEEFLIVGIPAVPGIVSKLVESLMVTIRYMYAGGVYGFKSTILHCERKPTLLLFITYPNSVEVFNLRKAQRVANLTPAMAKIGDNQFGGVLMDLSEGGCRLSIESDQDGLPTLTMGDELSVFLPLAGIEGPLVIRGRVQNLRQDTSFVEMGIQFDESETEPLANLGAYLKNLTKLQDYIPKKVH